MKNVLKRVGVFTLAVALVAGVLPMPHVTEAAPEEDVFRRALDKFFDGKKDTRTLAILRQIGE